MIKRALYCSSRVVAKQKNAELGFANSKYGEIKKVYSIWICIGHAKQKNDVINLCFESGEEYKNVIFHQSIEGNKRQTMGSEIKIGDIRLSEYEDDWK